jgi:hypothetical protein
MARFQYEEAAFPDVVLKADNREEISVEIAQTFALLKIGHELSGISDAIYQLVEAVRTLEK